LRRRAYQRYRERQRVQKEDDRRTIEALNARLASLEVERESLVQRVEVLQKVIWTAACDFTVALSHGRRSVDVTAIRHR